MGTLVQGGHEGSAMEHRSWVVIVAGCLMAGCGGGASQPAPDAQVGGSTADAHVSTVDASVSLADAPLVDAPGPMPDTGSSVLVWDQGAWDQGTWE